MAATKNTALAIPGVDDPDQLLRIGSQPVAIFVKGVEAYAVGASSKVTLGSGTKTVSGQLIGSDVGRLYNLSLKYLNQSPAVVLGNHQAGAYNFQDSIHFSALADAYGKDAIGPLEIYTVLVVLLDAPTES